MSNLFGLASQILKPLFGVIDKAVTDKDLAQQLKHDLQMQMFDADSEFMKSATSIITAEAQGESWLQRSWRPITMLSFLGLIWAYWLGFSPEYVTSNPAVVEQVFRLLQIGIGGYIAGRSGEKIVQHWKASDSATPQSGFISAPGR